MNVFLTFLPLLVLVFAIVFLVKKYMNRNKFPTKVTHWLLFVYVAVLLTATGISPFIMDKKITYKEWNSQKEMEANKINYHEKLQKGQTNGLEPIQESKSFDYDKSTLMLDFGDMESVPHIYVERKGKNDGFIDVHAFTGGVYIGGMNITDVVEPHDFSLHGNTLSMSRVLKDAQFSSDFSDMYDVNVSIVQREFPLTQFTDGMGIFGSLNRAGIDIYLQVPKDLEITNESEYAIIQVAK